MLNLNDPSLFKQQALINGVWQAADTGEQLEVHDPANGKLLGIVPQMGAKETQRAITAAHTAWPAWQRKTAQERAQILRQWANLLLLHAADLAQIMTAEQGKPLSEASGEITYAASFLEWFAEEGKRAYGEVIPSPASDRRLLTLKQAIGVTAAITPWNFPAAMITRKAGPALAAGCTMIVKPAEQTPFSALALAELGQRAGIPAGVLNVVTGKAEEIGGALTASPLVRKLSFTGSTAVGRILMRQSADTIKKLSLELGGNAPFIVFDDADIEAAIAGAFASKYRNTGQTCVCANRLFIHSSVYDLFAERFTAKVNALKVGPGTEPGVQQGPLIDAAAFEKIACHVADARRQGGKISTGGRPHGLGGNFYEPTVILDAHVEMLCAKEESFGPLAPLIKFDTEEEVIELANATEFGLASYFYSRDIGRVFRVAEALEYGMVGVNTGSISNEVAPFGGIKQSGLGREGAHQGLDEYLETKYLCLAGMD